MKKNYFVFGLIVVLAASATAGLIAWKRVGARRNETKAIVTRIKQIAKVVTVEYSISAHVFKKRKAAWYEWKDAKWLAKASGVVRGSVDLKKATIDVSHGFSDRCVTIAFAPDAVEVSYPDIKPGDIVCRKIDDPNVFNRITDEDYDKARDEAFQRMKEIAETYGLRDKAMERVEIVLREFLSPLGYRLEVIFQAY